MPHARTHSPQISSHDTRESLGRNAGQLAGEIIRSAQEEDRRIRLMLAAAPSQYETLNALLRQPGINWGMLDCFHMDDYIGLPVDSPQGFGNWLQSLVFDKVPEAKFHRINTLNNAADEAARYEEVMGDEPFDLVLLGLGVNGHLAFNDPPADFSYPRSVRIVQLDRISRQQQVDEGHFPSFEAVPEEAITVTIPRLLNAANLIASVPGHSKMQAVDDTLSKPISAAYPGTALRTHPRSFLFVDAESDPRRQSRTGTALGAATTG